MTTENSNITIGPAIHPSCAVAHANDSTPEPITAVIMWALAVHTLPVNSWSLNQNPKFKFHDSQITIHNSQSTIHNPQFTIHNSQR